EEIVPRSMPRPRGDATCKWCKGSSTVGSPEPRSRFPDGNISARMTRDRTPCGRQQWIDRTVECHAVGQDTDLEGLSFVGIGEDRASAHSSLLPHAPFDRPS